MTGSWLELAIISFIIIGIGAVIFRGGQANPETTGRLHKRLSGVEGEVKALTSRMGEMEKKYATSADIRRLEQLLKDAQSSRSEQGQILSKQSDRIDRMAEDLAAQSESSRHTSRQVDRLYDHIVSKGMNS